MTNFERGIIDLVKSAIKGSVAELTADFDWDKAYKIGVKHQLTPILYYGISNSQIVPPPHIAANLELATYQHVSVSAKQLYELKRIFKAFDENEIDYMPLKGTLLKYLYPKPEMRSMGDADILIKVEQYEKIIPILLSLEYVQTGESNHELIWNRPKALHLELHKRLIPSYNKDYYAYYGDGWKLAQKTNTTRYALSDEDNFIYLFTHYAKHYRDGGIGIRHLTDFYVYLNAKPNMDKKYIQEELEKLQLLEFYENTIKTLLVWFEGSKGNEITDFMTSRIIKSGSYGLSNKMIISSAVRMSKSSNSNKKIRIKKMLNMLFLPLENMKQLYPSLEKAPFLLPFMWVARFFKVVFYKHDKIKMHNENLKYITTENISDYQKELNFVGLDFNFEE